MDTYELVELPKGKRALKNKWVYKLKPGDARNPPRYKARIVVKGFQQKKGVDFDDIFAPVCFHMTTQRRPCTRLKMRSLLSLLGEVKILQ